MSTEHLHALCVSTDNQTIRDVAVFAAMFSIEAIDAKTTDDGLHWTLMLNGNPNSRIGEFVQKILDMTDNLQVGVCAEGGFDTLHVFNTINLYKDTTLSFDVCDAVNRIYDEAYKMGMDGKDIIDVNLPNVLGASLTVRAFGGECHQIQVGREHDARVPLPAPQDR